MDQSPYTPPKSPAPSPDQPSKQSWTRWILEGFVDLIFSATSTVFTLILMIAWGVGLVYGWNSNSRLIFHLIYAALILGPAIAIVIFAFAGRASTTPESSPNIANWIGTAGCCLIGIIFLGLYATALFNKLLPDTADQLFSWF